MSTASPLEQLMLDLINAERAAAGVSPLTFDDKLNDSSEAHSRWMLNADQFSHAGMGGSSPQERMEAAGFKFEGDWRSGENIGFQSERGAPGLADDVRQIHESLMNSPGHRANILNPDFNEIGIGVEQGDFTQGGTFDSVMVTQNFARTDAVDEPAPAPQVPTPPDVVAGPDTPVNPETPVNLETPADPDVVAGPVTPETPTEPEVVEDPDPETPDTPVEVAECDDPDGEDMPVTDVNMELPDDTTDEGESEASDDDEVNDEEDEDVVVDASDGDDDDSTGDADDDAGLDDGVTDDEPEDDSSTDQGDMANLDDMPELEDMWLSWGCGKARPGEDEAGSQKEAGGQEDAASQGQLAKNYVDFGGFRIFFEPLDGAGEKPGSEPSRWMTAEDQQFGNHCGASDADATNTGSLDLQALPDDLSEFFGQCGGQHDNWLNFA